MNRTSGIRELNLEEIDLVSGGTHVSLNIGGFHLDASHTKSGGMSLGISFGGEVGVTIGTGGAYGYVGGCVASTFNGGHAGCTPT